MHKPQFYYATGGDIVGDYYVIISHSSVGRSLLGRNSGGCDNYFHQCITSHLGPFGLVWSAFEEYKQL